MEGLTWVSGAEGARLRLMRWPAPGGAPVLVLPGRSEPVEKYAEVIADLGRRGYAAWALDWRGQGLSDRFPGAGARGHVDDFDVLADDLAAVVQRIGGRPLLLAHSMGAAVALRLCQMRPETTRHLAGLVLSAPMIRVPTWGHPEKLVRLLARAHRLAGFGTRYVWGARDWAEENHAFAGNRRTRSAARFDREVALMRAHPDLRVGGPTWGWTAAAFRLTDQLRGPWPQDALHLPMDIVAGSADPYVALDAQRAFFARFTQARVHAIPGALHEVMMETDDARTLFWAAFDTAAQRAFHQN